MISPRIDSTTPVIVQGISGRAGRLHSRLMKEYGTNIVAGVSPKMEASDVNGIPLFPDCAAAARATGATTCVALVGAMQLLDAMRDAITAGVRYIVTPTEGMPVHDALRAQRLVRDAGALWVGGSTPGMAVAGAAKLGVATPGEVRSLRSRRARSASCRSPAPCRTKPATVSRAGESARRCGSVSAAIR